MKSDTMGLRQLTLLLLLVGCGADTTADEDTLPVADDLARARAAAAFTPGSAQNLTAAWAAMAPLIEGEAPRADDLLRAGIIAFHRQDGDDLAATLLERAYLADPGDPAVRFMRGCIALNRNIEPELAAIEFRAVLAVDPDDAPSRLQLATALEYVNDFAGAAEQLQAVRDRGLGANTPFYAQATYRLGRLRIRLARGDKEAQAAALALLEEHTALKNAGKDAADDTMIWTSSYGRLRAPTPRALPRGAPGAPGFPAFSSWEIHDPPTHVAGLLAADLDGDGQPELIAWGQDGVQLLNRNADGSLSSRTVHRRAVSQARLGDLDEADPNSTLYHPAPELLCIEQGAARLYSYDAAAQAFLPLPDDDEAAADVRGAVFVDLDHQGSLDLVLAGAQGLELRRNDGADDRLQRLLAHATPAPFGDIGSCRALLVEDIDGNRAVDLLAVGDTRVIAVAGLWDGLFADRTAAWGLADVTVDAAQASGGLTLADVDNDGLADLIQSTANGLNIRLHDGERFGPPQALDIAGDAPVALVAVVAIDLNRDGFVDLLGRDRNNGAVLAIPGPLTRRSGALATATLVEGLAEGSADEQSAAAPGEPAGLLVTDLDGDGALDLAVGGSSLRVWRGELPGGNGLTLRLAGRKSNTHGVGAIVEVRAGALYRRIFCRGESLVIGLGDAVSADVATVRWPNGVTQPAYDLAAGSTYELVQIEGLTGSCPFLYTWNGSTFEFITDVLGTTPLGLPMAPGVHVPFDHEEYVRISGAQLSPRNGRLELVLTEELREVTYLDQVRLHAIDHPAQVEIQPNESFVFPPFPPHHVHTLADVVAPARVLASNGEDVSERLAAIDGRHARTFVPRGAQFRGLTEPWHLDILLAESAAERAALAAAPRLRLALSGWLLWPDASVNVSAARHPTVAFEPPLLSVPDGDGGWRAAGPPIGFIAGKTKTMIVDITDIVDRDDPRLRLSTTLALSYDAIRLVLDDDDAPYTDTPLAPGTARVHWRGFSALLPDPVGEFGEIFDWDVLAPARWDQHPGNYTRYGDVLELLQTVDDRTVIFGAGDALTLSFDAAPLPELPEGWTRDWLLYLDGWAKDMDPNTSAARTVEPLPFHGMSDYPPPPGEDFPDGPLFEAWRRQYNTRPGRRLLPDLARPGTAPQPTLRSGPAGTGDD